jgi:hypothetical protein
MSPEGTGYLPIGFVMDVFKTADQKEDLEVKSHHDLNEDIVTLRESMHHG